MSFMRRSSSESSSSSSNDETERPFCQNPQLGRKKLDAFVQIDPTIRRKIMHPQCGTPKLISEEFAKEEAKSYPSGRSSPPMLTKEPDISRRYTVPINELWDEEKRLDRPAK